MTHPFVHAAGLALVVGLGVAATPALAQEHPAFLPTRDVAVTYQLSSGGQQGQVTHLYYTTQGDKLRIDTPGNAGFTVLDKGAGRRMMVNNEARQYVSEAMDPNMAEGFVLNSSMQYARGGQDTVAGIPCTDWTVKSAQASGTACVTDDGVLLRGTGTSQQGQTSLVATDVRYGPQPESLFVPPPGFSQMDMSQVQQGQGPGGQGPGGQAPGGQ